MNFGVPADHKVKVKDGEKRDKYQDLARQLKKLWNMKGTGGLGKKRTNIDHPNTEKSHRDLKRLALTQTSAENHRPILV